METIVMKKQAGLSLIELMIAITLGIFITGGMIQLFVNSKQSYRVQENLSRLQENGRFSMNFITTDIRMADFWGCTSSASIESNLNLGSSFDNILQDPISGTNNDGLNGSDSIFIKGLSSSQIFVVEVPAVPSSDLKVTDNSGLKENEIVIVSDCAMGDIFQITNDPGTGGAPGKDEVIHNTGGNPSPGDADYPGNLDASLQKRYGTDAQIYRLHSVRYFISAGQSGQPALFRSINSATSEELIEGIENMQILYGEDTDVPPDNSPDYYVPAGTAGLDMDNVVSIRVSLLATTLDDNLALQAVPYTIFGATTTPADRKIRRVFTSTIAVRNRLPLIK
mgnify:CR=1 FL=1